MGRPRGIASAADAALLKVLFCEIAGGCPLTPFAQSVRLNTGPAFSPPIKPCGLACPELWAAVAMAIAYPDRTDRPADAHQSAPARRRVAFAALAIFILLGPAPGQLFGVHSVLLREW